MHPPHLLISQHPVEQLEVIPPHEQQLALLHQSTGIRVGVNLPRDIRIGVHQGAAKPNLKGVERGEKVWELKWESGREEENMVPVIRKGMSRVLQRVRTKSDYMKRRAWGGTIIITPTLGHWRAGSSGRRMLGILTWPW